MKATVIITPKNGVLDPQGKAIGHTLTDLGFKDVGEIRVGKHITLDLPEGTSEDTIKEMCEKLLANPVIEDYTVEV